MEYETRIKEFFSRLGESHVMCLATSLDNRVTARSMSVIIHQENFYFQTDINFLKYHQLHQNPNVALCLDNIQIEGIASELGIPSTSGCSFFTKAYSKHYHSSYEKYSSLKTEVLIEVKPRRITIWDYEAGQPYREFLDMENKTYRKEYYSIKD